MLSIESSFLDSLLLPVSVRVGIFLHRIYSICSCTFPLAEFIGLSGHYKLSLNYSALKQKTTLIFLITLGI